MAEKKVKATEQTDMDKLTTEMMEHICDNLCKHPIRVGQIQEELDDICAECKMGKFVCDILNTYNHRMQQLTELKEESLDPVEMCEVKMLIDEFMEYKRLQEQGLLHKFTCKVGDTVYEIIRGMIVPSMVTGFRIGKMMGEDQDEYEEDYEENTWYIQAENGMSSQSFPLSAVGKTYWFTREKAQAALEKMKGE